MMEERNIIPEKLDTINERLGNIMSNIAVQNQQILTQNKENEDIKSRLNKLEFDMRSFMSLQEKVVTLETSVNSLTKKVDELVSKMDRSSWALILINKLLYLAGGALVALGFRHVLGK